MLLHNKHTVLISPANSKLIKALEARDIHCIYSEEISELIEYEKYHADMQLLEIHDTAFIPENSKCLYEKIKPYFSSVITCKPLSGKYPHNVSLNASLIDNYLFCRETALATEVRERCNENNIKIINVNQGYAKCSTLIINNSIITSDVSIKKAAENVGIRVLLIQPGFIELNGAEYGFIGGASGVIGDTVYFFGNISKHPNYTNIASFINENGMNFISLTDEKLQDIGGFVNLK